MEALHERMVIGVDGQLGERKRLLPILFLPFPVEAGDGEWLTGGHPDGPAHVRRLLPIWFEETGHGTKQS